MATMKLAVPTMGAAGLDAQRAGHFGHCDCFTVATITDGEIGEVAAVDNPPHEEGGCLRPVGLLADAGVDAIEAGITVYFDNVHPQVGDAVRAVAAGEAPVMGADQACQHHH